MSEKEKYLDIREKLKSLPRVEARDDFVNQLQAKINIIEAEKQSNSIHKENTEKLEGGFFAKLFGQSTNPWLVPAFGVTAVIALVFVWVFVISNNNTSEDMTSSENNTSEQITGNSESDRKDNLVSKEEKTETGGEEEIPGENIANDLDIGRNESLSSRLSTSDSRTDADDEFTGDKELAPVRKVTEEETGVMEQKVVSPGVDMERTDGVVSKKSGKSPNPKEIDSTVKESPKTKASTMPKDKKGSDKSSKTEGGLEKNEQKNVEAQTLTDEVKQESNESEKTSINNVIDSTSLESLRERVIEK